MNNQNQNEINGKGSANIGQFQQGMLPYNMNILQQQQQQQQLQNQQQQQQLQLQTQQQSSHSWQQSQQQWQQTPLEMSDTSGRNEFHHHINQLHQNSNQFNNLNNYPQQQQQQVLQLLQCINNNDDNNNLTPIQRQKKFQQLLQNQNLNYSLPQSSQIHVGGGTQMQFNQQQNFLQKILSQKQMNLKNSNSVMEQEGRMNPEINSENSNNKPSEIDLRNNPSNTFSGQKKMIEHVYLDDEEDDDELNKGDQLQNKKAQNQGKYNEAFINQLVNNADIMKKIKIQQMKKQNQKMRDEHEPSSDEENQFNKQDNQDEQYQEKHIQSIKLSTNNDNNIKNNMQMINLYSMKKDQTQKEHKIDDYNDDKEESKRNSDQDDEDQELEQYQTSQVNSKQKLDNPKLQNKIKQINQNVPAKFQETNFTPSNISKKDQIEQSNEKIMKKPFSKIKKNDENIKNQINPDDNSNQKIENPSQNSSDNEVNQQNNNNKDFEYHQQQILFQQENSNNLNIMNQSFSNHLQQLQQNVSDISPIHQHDERRNRLSPSSLEIQQLPQQRQTQQNNFIQQSQNDQQDNLHLQQQQQLSQQNNQNQSKSNQINLRNLQNPQIYNMFASQINQLNHQMQINNNIFNMSLSQNSNLQQQNITQQLQMNQLNLNAQALNTDRTNNSNRQSNNQNPSLSISHQGNQRPSAIQNFNQQIPVLNQQLTQRAGQSQNASQGQNQSNQEQNPNNIQQIFQSIRGHNHLNNPYNPNIQQMNQIFQNPQNLTRSAAFLNQNMQFQGTTLVSSRNQNIVSVVQNHATFPTEGDNGPLSSLDQQNYMLASNPRQMTFLQQQNQNGLQLQNNQNLINQNNRTQIQRQNHLPVEVKNKYYTYRQNNHPQEYGEDEPYMKVTVMKTNQDNTSQNNYYIITPRGMVKSKKNTATDDIIIGRQENAKQQENSRGLQGEPSEIRPNDIVLPPSDRAISRIHCKLIYKDGFKIRRKVPSSFLLFLFGIKYSLPFNIGGIPDVALRLIWRFVREKNSFYIVDIGSAQGTFIKIRSEKSQVIEKGQVFLIGAETQFHILEVSHSNINDKDEKFEFANDNRMMECQSSSDMIPDEQDFINFLLHEKKQNTIIHGLTVEEQQKLDAINNQPDNDAQNNTTQLVDFKKNFKPYVKLKVNSTQTSYHLFILGQQAIDQGFKIGRSQECTIQININTISRKQSRIFYSQGKWQLKDGDMTRESANGTWISLNDYREKTESRNESDQKEIEDGSEIKISDSILKIEIFNNEVKKSKPKYSFNLEEQMEQEQDISNNSFQNNFVENQQDLDETG